MDSILTIQKVSQRSGVAASALRYYEAIGLIESQRSKSGHRQFERSVLRRLAFIVFAQRVGLSLHEVGEELGKLPTERIPTSKDWAKISKPWTARIDDQIERLNRLRSSLSDCIGCGCLSLQRCSVLNAGDEAGKNAKGPSRWL